MDNLDRRLLRFRSNLYIYCDILDSQRNNYSMTNMYLCLREAIGVSACYQ